MHCIGHLRLHPFKKMSTWKKFIRNMLFWYKEKYMSFPGKRKQYQPSQSNNKQANQHMSKDKLESKKFY